MTVRHREDKSGAYELESTAGINVVKLDNSQRSALFCQIRWLILDKMTTGFLFFWYALTSALFQYLYLNILIQLIFYLNKTPFLFIV